MRQFFRIKNSPVHGKGAFATRDLVPGTVIGQYTGTRLRGKSRPNQINTATLTYLYVLSDGSMLDGSPMSNRLRWVNHSCEPNCQVFEIHDGKKFIQLDVEVLRPVLKGEELFIDYRLDFYPGQDDAEEDYSLFNCRCGSSLCRKTMFVGATK